MRQSKIITSKRYSMVMTSFMVTSLVIMTIVAASCGSTRTDTTPKMTIISPAEDSVYKAGDTIEYALEFERFTLVAPYNMRSGAKNITKHDGSDHSTEDSSSADSSSSGIDSSETDSSAAAQETATPEAEETLTVNPSPNETAETTGQEASETPTPQVTQASDDISSATNPSAREGHYHIYLDEATGSDAHITNWNYTGSFTIPGGITPGIHSLRFELRDNEHTPVGTDWSEAVLFFVVE